MDGWPAPADFDMYAVGTSIAQTDQLFARVLTHLDSLADGPLEILHSSKAITANLRLPHPHLPGQPDSITIQLIHRAAPFMSRSTATATPGPRPSTPTPPTSTLPPLS